MVEAEDKKKRKNSHSIDIEEDEVHREEIGQATQMLSAWSVKSITIMQISDTRISVLIVVRLRIFQKIVDLKMEEKRWPTSQKKLKKRQHY